MNKLTRVFALSLIIFILTGVCGCMNQSDNTIDRMLAHINEKYDDEFTYKVPFGGGASATSKTVLCTSAKFPDEDVYVVSYTDDNGHEVFADNYMNVKYRSQTEEMLNQIMSGIAGADYRLFYSIPLQSTTEGSSNDMPFEAFIAESSSAIDLIAVVSSSYALDQDAFASALQSALAENGMCCRAGTIYFDDGSGHYDNLTSADLSEYYNRHYYTARFTFTMNDCNRYATESWR